MNNSDKPAMPQSLKMSDATHIHSPGLTKREYFAGLAMQGLLAKHGDDDYEEGKIAEYAINHAEQLLEELEKDDG